MACEYGPRPIHGSTALDCEQDSSSRRAHSPNPQKTARDSRHSTSSHNAIWSSQDSVETLSARCVSRFQAGSPANGLARGRGNRALAHLVRSDGPVMAAEPTDEPAEGAPRTVIVFDAGESAAARAGRSYRWLDHGLRSDLRLVVLVGNGATISSFCVVSSRTSSNRHKAVGLESVGGARRVEEQDGRATRWSVYSPTNAPFSDENFLHRLPRPAPR
jgi:hypothetical protein